MTAGFHNLADIVRKRARTDPDNEALIDAIREVSFSWGELDRRRRQVANLLRSTCEPSARVATVLPICSVAAELVFATASAGLILVPVNERLTAHELAFVFGDAEVAAVITNADHIAAVREAVATASPDAVIYVVDAPAGDGLSYDAAVAASYDREPIDQADVDDVAMLIYTSGTTGRPKGVMLTHGNFLSSANNYLMESFAPGDGTYLACVPFSHVGCVVHLAAAMRGLTLVVTPFTPDRILTLIERHRVTHIAMVPTMIALVLNVEDIDRYDCSSLRRVLYAAAPMPLPLLRRAIAKFGPILEQFYGLTESTGLVTILRSDEHAVDDDATAATLSRLASCGKEVTGAWVDVLDTDGHPVAPGERGEIVIRGPGVMAGYWRNELATAATIKAGWLHSGDVGSRDADGFLTIVDRLKDVIITGGSNVYPKEVELVLQLVDGVSEASVVGVAHDVWGEIVTAVVVCESGREVPEEMLMTACQAELAPYKQPRVIRYADALPKNAMGKVDKVALRADLAAAGQPEPARSQ
ncbi:MAG TPA: AMP-binding protein [Mycobacteriales bacterium]|jgi:acyl-CoA synthetase (AMP-forming)/AMP-acid ligase II|nr:AMP-binding protein [Mycobacteriales bacterium]